MLKIVTAFGCLFITAGGARADDVLSFPSANGMVMRAGIEETAAKKTASPDRWLGAYAGLTGGYGNLWDSFNAHAKGKIIGGFAGYNIRVAGPIVGGLEMEYAHLNLLFDDNSGSKANETLIAKLRAGYAHDKFFAYGMVGAQYATAKVPVAIPGGSIVFNLADTSYVVGAGVDVAVTDRISVGAEYSRSYFHSFDYPNFPAPVAVRIQEFKARLGYKIN